MNRVFVLGNATIDVTMRMVAFPAPGETVLSDGVRRGPGGKGLNQAVAASRTGVAVTFISPVGDDEAGRMLRAFVSAEPGLEPRWIPSGQPTDMSVIWVAGDAENMIVSSADSARTLDALRVPALLDGIGNADMLLVQGNLSAETTLAACRLAKDAGARVMINPAPLAWDMHDILPLADVLICNLPEALAITGESGEAAARLLSEATGGIVILTLGASGALLVSDGSRTAIPATFTDAVDTSGAGDTVAGVAAAALTLGRSAADALRVGMWAAAVTVTRPGTLSAFPSADEMRRICATP